MGRLATYSDIAGKVCTPAAARAVGAAVGKNPVAFVVPCHRVIGKSGDTHRLSLGHHAQARDARLGSRASRAGGVILSGAPAHTAPRHPPGSTRGSILTRRKISETAAPHGLPGQARPLFIDIIGQFLRAPHLHHTMDFVVSSVAQLKTVVYINPWPPSLWPLSIHIM